jgi:hypothetical protein
MANESIPLFEVGPISATASSAVTGKRFVSLSSALNAATGVLPGVAHATAAAYAVGVAARDAASGARVAVEHRPGTIVPVTCSAAVTFGAEVEVATGGKAVTKTAGVAVGRAWSTTSAADTDLFVELY